MSLATVVKLADDLGVGMSKAQRIVDDVGTEAAKKFASLEDSAFRVGRLGLAGGGGYAAYQTIQEYQQTQQKELTKETVADILANSDLSSQEKRDLINDLSNGGLNDDANSGGSLTSKLLDDPAKMVAAFIVVLVVVQTLTDSTVDNLIGS